MSELEAVLASTVPSDAALLAGVLRALGCNVDTLEGRDLLVYPPKSDADDIRAVDVARFAEAMPPCVKTVGDLHLHLRIEGLKPSVDVEALKQVLRE